MYKDILSDAFKYVNDQNFVLFWDLNVENFH